MSAPNATPLPAPPLPPGRPRLVVTGLMGTGKTEAGRRAAALLALPFFDLDAAIARRAGASVRAIFERSGEPAFRALEREAVRDAARLSAAVIATGGGAALDGPSYRPLAEGAVAAVLGADAATLERRLAVDRERPLLRPQAGGRLGALQAERAAAYAAAGEALDTSALSHDEVAAELARRYERAAPRGPTQVAIDGPEGEYAVVIGALEACAPVLARALGGAATVAVVADGQVVDTVGARVAAIVAAAGSRVAGPIGLPPGEAAKTIESVAALWARFREAGLDPGSAVVAVGGGAALDAAGFAAATFARGVRLVNVPTTLLAMVDAALGGKVAIDHAGAKNLVGAFHHPSLVAIDPETLATLPEAALRAGLAEVVKAAALASPLLLEALEAGAVDPVARTADRAWTIEQAVRIKAAYVAADPWDRGVRRSLNLGHTFAHAIEAASAYQVAHGEAVAIGLLAAARLGHDAGITPPGTEERLRAVLTRLGLPTVAPPGLRMADLVRALSADKKRRAGRLAFVVPAADGAALLSDLDADVALEALRA